MNRMLCMTTALAVLGLTVNACEERTTDSVPSSPEFQTTATIRELMHSVVDPNADAVWLSVQWILDEDGTHEIRPRTDEEWARVRRGAITLLESANLLMMQGRAVAHPGERSFAPGIELEPNEIAELIAADRDAWNARAIVLSQVMAQVVEAIDAQDADEVFNLGEQMEAVCESCHQQYWYPGQRIPPLRVPKAPTKGGHSEGRTEASGETLRDSFAERIATSPFVTDFEQDGDILGFRGPDGSGDTARWVVRIESALVEPNQFDDKMPHVGRITAEWTANGSVGEYLGTMTALPDEFLDRGLGQECWAYWISAEKRWDW